jgi:hypothetical protein
VRAWSATRFRRLAAWDRFHATVATVGQQSEPTTHYGDKMQGFVSILNHVVHIVTTWLWRVNQSRDKILLYVLGLSLFCYQSIDVFSSPYISYLMEPVSQECFTGIHCRWCNQFSWYFVVAPVCFLTHLVSDTTHWFLNKSIPLLVITRISSQSKWACL